MSYSCKPRLYSSANQKSEFVKERALCRMLCGSVKALMQAAKSPPQFALVLSSVDDSCLAIQFLAVAF